MSKIAQRSFLAALLLGLCVTQTALAEERMQPKVDNNGDYSYRFTDEDLLGDTLHNVGDTLRFLPPGKRVLLLRPRTSLVQEIVKSAENL